MVGTSATSGASSSIFDTVTAKIRIKEALVLFLIWSIVLNVFLVSKLNTLESDHDLHDIHSSSSVNTLRSSINHDVTKQKKSAQKNNDDGAVLLRCESFGGPSNEAAIDDIVYWRTMSTPPNKQFRTIYEKKPNEVEKYFIYEPDDAGFSNVRITFETVVAIAKATGRTLVLSPKRVFHQLYFEHPEGWRSYSYTDFFHISDISVISMEDYLKRIALNGLLHNAKGEVSFPPNNRTDWDVLKLAAGSKREDLIPLYTWISESMLSIDWNRDACIIPFPELENGSNTAMIKAMNNTIYDKNDSDAKRIQSYLGRPIPVNSSMKDRLREMIANRRKFCYYNESHQTAPSIYMDGHEYTGVRPLIQFFAYLFFESWEQDLQMKRYIRDHLRFADIIQCAAARIVQAIRDIARKGGNGNNSLGGFDTMHIRRGDFKGLAYYQDGIVDPNDILSSNYFQSQRTIYIATDETDLAYFEPLRQNHTVLFISDFYHLIQGMDPNYYGMIEQLICAKGDKFVGTYYSTFSAYINRLRGYHAQKSRSLQAMQGSLNSEYMGHDHHFRDVMKTYASIHGQFWTQEWPAAWRDIDFDV